MATRSSRCSRSYHRLNSASLAGSMSIDVSSIPFPASGIFGGPLCGNSRGQIRDRFHHRIPDAGIVQRVAGALDETNLRIGPHCAKRMRCRRRTQQIVAALHDDTPKPFEFAGCRQNLPWFHEAVVLEIVRFHEWRDGQGMCRVQRIEIEPNTPRGVLGKYPFGVMPGARGWAGWRGTGIDNAAPVRVERLPAFFRRQYTEEIIAKVWIEARQDIDKCAFQLGTGAEEGRAPDDAREPMRMPRRIWERTR